MRGVYVCYIVCRALAHFYQQQYGLTIEDLDLVCKLQPHNHNLVDNVQKARIIIMQHKKKEEQLQK